MYNYDVNNKKSFKKIVVLIAVVIVAIVSVAVVGLVLKNRDDSTKTASLTFFVRPTDATVFLDGEPIDISSGVVHVIPGDHSIAIIRAGFFPGGEEFTIKEGEIRDFDYALSPFSEEAKKLAEDFEY